MSSSASLQASPPSAIAPSASAAVTPPAAIDGQLPPPTTLALSVKASCPAKTCRIEGSLLEAILGPSTSRSPAGIWEEDLGADALMIFPRRKDVDVLGVVLAGTLTLSADDSKEDGNALEPWHAFVAPGAGVTLRAKGGPARVALIVVTSGEPLNAKPPAGKTSTWTARPAPVGSIDLANATDLGWGKGAYHARIGFDAQTSSRASLGILKMSPDGVVSPHEHDKEWEHMVVLQGEGDFMQGAGDDVHTLHATDGVIFSVPPATRHEWRPARTRSFLGIQVYTPPGPEQRFKKLASPP